MARGRKRKGAGRRGRPSLLSNIPTAELRKELQRRQGMLEDLVRQRDVISNELRELEELFGSVPNGHSVSAAPAASSARRGRPARTGRRRGRPPGRRNKTSLVTSLQSTLAGKTMSVTEVADAVQKGGYKTKSPNFRTIVNQALLSNPDKFKKVDRGQYTAR